MRTIRRFLPIPLLVLLILSDWVALQEIRHSMTWIVGDRALLASFAMLFLANAVTMAFFFEGLTRGQVRMLHAIALVLYSIVSLAMYATGVERGLEMFPVEVAQDAFGIGHLTAVRLAAVLVSVGLAGASYSFWSVMGSHINNRVNSGSTVKWQESAARQGLPVDNILDLSRSSRATGD